MKKHIHKMIYTLVLSLFVLGANAQIDLQVNATQNYTNFNFEDENGHKDANYKGKFLGAYNVGYSIFSKSGVFFTNSIGMKNVGATYVHNNINYDWDLRYATVELGLGYHHKLSTYNSFGYYFSASPYYAYLTRANQRVNDKNIDVIATKDLSVGDFGVNLRTGMIIPLSHLLDLSAGGVYSPGLSNIEGKNTTQTTKNYAYGVTLGLSFRVDYK
jgi:hypothetical protein